MVLNVSSCPVGFLYSLNPSSVNLTEVAAEAQALDGMVATSVVWAIVVLIASMLVLFFGARLFFSTLFLSAFGVSFYGGLIVTREVLAAVPSMSATPSCVTLGVTPLVIGLIGGCCAVRIVKLGFALLGAAAGAGAGHLLYTMGLSAIHNPTIGAHQDLISILCVVLGAILGAVLMVAYQKSLLILATSAVGAAGATPAIQILAAHADARFLTEANNKSSPFGWAQPVCMLVLFGFGLFYQCRTHKPKKEEEARVQRNNAPLLARP